MVAKKRKRPTKKQVDRLRVQISNLMGALRLERQKRETSADKLYVELLQAYDRANNLITKTTQQNERLKEALKSVSRAAIRPHYKYARVAHCDIERSRAVLTTCLHA